MRQKESFLTVPFFSFTEKQLEAVTAKIPPNTKDTKLCLALTLPSSVNNEFAFPENIKAVGLHRFKTFEKSVIGYNQYRTGTTPVNISRF